MKLKLNSAVLALCGTLLCGTAHAAIHSDGKNKKMSARSSSISFDENSRVLNLGLGVSGGNYYKISKGAGYSAGKGPLLSLSYDHALGSKVGPGYIGIGGYFSYQNAFSKYDNMYYNGSFYYYKHNWNYYMLGGRGTYHPDFLNWDRAEVYAGVILGARINNYSYTTNSPDPESMSYKYSDQTASPAGAVLIGVRWYFATRVGLYAETGTGPGLSYATGGLSFKF